MIAANDVLVQHMRIRPGDDRDGPAANIRDAISIEVKQGGPSEVFNVVVDHCSLSWAMDESAATWWRGVHDITFSNSIIAETLDDTFAGRDHSKGLLIGDHTRRIAVIRNFLIHNDDRNPVMKGDSSALVVNTLVFNYGRWPVGFMDSEGSGPMRATVVGNVYVRGPSSPSDHHTVLIMDTVKRGTAIHLRDNSAWDNNADPAKMTQLEAKGFNPFVAEAPVWVEPLTVLPVSAVEQQVLGDAGAWPRDPVDTRLLNEFRTRSGRIINSTADVGGLPAVEEQRVVLPIPERSQADDDGDGYDNLEAWVRTLGSGQRR